MRLKRATLVLLACGLMSASAHGAEIGQFKDWTAHALNSNSGKVCYIVTKPERSQPSNVNRDDIFFYVTTWAGQANIAEPSVVTGYPYKPGSTTTISIGSETFSMFTKADSAWVADRASEGRLIAAMRKGAKMIVKGTSSRGTVTTDTYSLSGVTAGLGSIAKSCG